MPGVAVEHEVVAKLGTQRVTTLTTSTCRKQRSASMKRQTDIYILPVWALVACLTICGSMSKDMLGNERQRPIAVKARSYKLLLDAGAEGREFEPRAQHDKDTAEKIHHQTFPKICGLFVVKTCPDKLTYEAARPCAGGRPSLSIIIPVGSPANVSCGPPTSMDNIVPRYEELLGTQITQSSWISQPPPSKVGMSYGMRDGSMSRDMLGPLLVKQSMSSSTSPCRHADGNPCRWGGR